MMTKPTQEEAVAVTKVFWDINKCPVPSGCDPHRVRPCIKLLLEKNGYRGPLTVTAFGKLADVPIDMLREVFSSGVDLLLVPYGTLDIMRLIDITERNPPPVNFMVISDPKACPDLTRLLLSLSYNPLQPFPYHHSMETLLSEGALPTETAESVSWDCLVCARDPPGRSFDSFFTHLASEEHHQLQLSKQLRAPPKPPVVTSMVHSPDKINLGDARSPLLTQSGYDMVDWEAVKSAGKTIVFWHINSCPVPFGFNPRMLGPCIRQFLKKEGCLGPLSIIAIGVLTHVPDFILSDVFSSGISLHNVPYGPSDIEKLIYDYCFCTGPRLNIMVISNCTNFACMPDFVQRRINLLKPFPNDSLQRFILPDEEYLKEDNCSEHSLWLCSLCSNRDATTYFSSFQQGFEPFSPCLKFGCFIDHLYGLEHEQKMMELCPLNEQLQRMREPLSVPPEKNPMAVTAVYWDIKSCPVPHGCHPRQVGPWINQFFENEGYCGPLTITAIGSLSDIPKHILEGVYSGGVALHNIYEGFSDIIYDLVCTFTDENPPPANIMVISDSNFFAYEKDLVSELSGYNLLPCDSCLFMAGALEEDYKCCYEKSKSAFWICSICDDIWGLGFENFTAHVASRPHQRELLDYLPGYARFTRRE